MSDSVIRDTKLESLSMVASKLQVEMEDLEIWRLSGCSELNNAPYDYLKIAKWRGLDAEERLNSRLNAKDLLEFEKLKLEVRMLEKENRPFLKNPLLWAAALASGVALSPEVRNWMAYLEGKRNRPQTMPSSEDIGVASLLVLLYIHSCSRRYERVHYGSLYFAATMCTMHTTHKDKWEMFGIVMETLFASRLLDSSGMKDVFFRDDTFAERHNVLIDLVLSQKGLEVVHSLRKDFGWPL